MAFYYHYLTLLFTLLLIYEATSLLHDDISGFKYIVLDKKSNNAAFYSSLFKNGKIDQNKLTSLSTRGKRSLTDSPILYSSNSSRSGLATEYEFHGDNHSVAFLHWSGSRSQVIFIFTSNYQSIQRNPGGSVHVENAYLWRSTDYGTSFQREDQTKFNKGSKNINGIHFCKGNNKRVVVYDKKGKWVYISDDEGDSYAAYQVNFTPQEILCTRDSGKNFLVAFDETTSKLYHAKDDGKNWRFICNDVVQYFWGTNSTTLFIETQQPGHKYTSVLKYIHLPGDASDVKVFDALLGGFVTRSFKVNGKYMFVKKMYPQMAMYVSYNGSSFKKAMFPFNLDVKDFNVVDASEDEVLSCIRHDDYYNLYISDKTGTKYSLSLRRILATSSYQWGRTLKLADIHRVRSLRGVYIANIRRKDAIVRTFITFDKGGEWNRLAIPDNVQCKELECGLNLHMVHSERYYQISSVLSSESALGLIMAQGNVGRYLNEETDVYLSSDGGLHWNKILNGSHDYVFGDHGGLIVAVALGNYTKKVWYSCTEGKFWSTIEMEKNVRAYGLVTEPGETTWVSNIFGQHLTKSFEWLSVKLNFSSVFERKCTDQDYTLWTPNDERMKGQCLLGEHMVYERRKADICCYNGKQYEREINQTSCNCSLEDFTCDFGFQNNDISDSCVPISEDLIVPKVCPEFQTYMRSSGYRKVAGDRCVGGIEKDFYPVKTLCPVKVPSGLSIVLKRTTVAAHIPITFNLKQEQGSTGSTWYLWDFGDGSKPINVTGITKAQKQNHTFTDHGSFNVTVTASNSMGTTSTRIAVQVIDAILRVLITPPHAVLIGQPAPFNITLSSQHTERSWVAEHGYVHFVWTFEPKQRPNLTWENEVEHTFTKAGVYTVKVEAINAISRQYGQVTIHVYDDLRTLRISFDDELDNEYKDSQKWRDEFRNMFLAKLTSVVFIPKSRLEVYVLPGLPTQVDVSIKPKDTNDNHTMDQIVDRIKVVIKQKRLVIQLSEGKSTAAVYAELLDNSGKKPIAVDDKQGNQDTRLAIAIGLAAGFIVIFLVGIIFYVYRRYMWIYRRYSRLSMNGSRPDGFIPLHPGGQESVGYNADDDVVRYAVPETEDINDSEDELLLDDHTEPGRLSLVINEDTQQDNSQSTDAARA
ncbi:VPS10 domain-containing receptor SorCS1-like [Actinia tenebrosa]|uniref:VPS10 domain-containing receptor SorCS1-like n=1 Tax=Actinia tenebrosa TaxID=6105 RepID=A0A6P8HAP6_ACTTE|nr:VPS10 domain-containing receptor SorCS1-like [Actinia tenebrosa]